MTQSEKLKALVQKATDNGLVTPLFSWISEDYQALLDYWLTNDNYKAIIFNHDFAKSLFPDISSPDRTILLDSQTGFILNIEDRFKDYLSSAVISDNPIDYLYKAVFNDD